MKRRAGVILVVFVLLMAVIILAFTQIQLNALPEPGKLETFLATQAKRILVYRDGRSGIPGDASVASPEIQLFPFHTRTASFLDATKMTQRVFVVAR